MSFFGLDTNPRDKGHQRFAPGFSATQDAFDGLAGTGESGNNDILDFEDTYEGFGGQLDANADDRNDDTFGDEQPITQASIGTDFDFSGRTGGVAQAFEEERMRYMAQHAPGRISPPKRAAKPKRTGYEYIPQLEADEALWGIGPKKELDALQAAAPMTGSAAPAAAPARKALTLEEVEAMMLAQSKPKAPAENSTQAQFGEPSHSQMPQGHINQRDHQQQLPQPRIPPHPQILQRPPGQHQPQFNQAPAQPPRHPADNGQFGAHRPPQILQRSRPAHVESAPQPHPVPTGPKHQARGSGTGQRQGPPRQILQNPNRLSGPGLPLAPQQPVPPMRQGHGHGQGQSQGQGHMRGSSYNGPIITNPQQILNLSEDERAAYLQEEARRAKRNHKIHLLSKYNGLMTPQDKSFITRIQLQQLVTATGSVEADGPEALLNEDFYYQVYSQIRGAPRQDPHQPANQFAQTYLFQTGNRYNRRHPRGGDNHMQRMEQQVQRAVEAAKAKPKNKQLVIEGSLGKISFSNAKTPKPLLNIKRLDSEPNMARRLSRHHDPAEERRSALKNIESIYSALMEMEDHARLRPLDESNMFEMWAEKSRQLNDKLWASLRAYEPVVENHAALHPFIAILSHSKGKKAVPRAFRHLSPEQRTILLTVTIIHLDSLDVVQNALASPIPAKVKEEIDLFANAVIPPLFSHINDEPLVITAGLLGLVISRCDVKAIVRTKIGLSILTMLVSRAEVLKEVMSQSPQQQAGQSHEWQQYNKVYNDFFHLLEPVLPYIFPDSNPLASDDVYVWQFLAAMGAAANADQQQRLVIGVKDRVMSAVGAARTLPVGEQDRRLGEVNLFMRALGLDVEFLA